MGEMKVVWLCNYSLQYLNNILKLDIDFSKLHPVPWLYHLVTEISKRKEIELHIVTLKPQVNKDHHIKKDGIHYHIVKERIVYVPQYINGKLSKRKLHGINIRWRRRVLNLIEKINPDIINVHGTEGELQFLVNELAFPTVVWMQGLMNRVIQLHDNRKYRRWLANENAILLKQKHFITFPGEMEDLIRSKNPGSIFYNIYHPNPRYAFELFRKNVKKENDLIFVGALIKRKGIEDFVRVVNNLKNTLPSLKAKILGYTGERDYLKYIEDLIDKLGLKQNIKIMGYVKNPEDVFMEIKKSRIFILPTYVDTGPRSVAESMTVGTPVISYNIGGLPEMIVDGYNGILIEPGNIIGLANATRNLLLNPSRAGQLRYNAYKTAYDKYYPRDVVDRLIKLYEKVIEQSNSAAA